MKFKVFKLLLIFTCVQVMANPFSFGFVNPQVSGYINFFFNGIMNPFQFTINPGEVVNFKQDFLNNVQHFDIYTYSPDAQGNNFVATVSVVNGRINRQTTINRNILFQIHQIPSYEDLFCLSGGISPPPYPYSRGCSIMLK